MRIDTITLYRPKRVPANGSNNLEEILAVVGCASHRIRCPLDISPSGEPTEDTSIIESRRYTLGLFVAEPTGGPLKPSLSILGTPGAGGIGPPTEIPDPPSSPDPVLIRILSPANRTGLISTWGESAGGFLGSSQRSC